MDTRRRISATCPARDALAGMLLLALLSPVSGQWVETEVLIPDEFSGVVNPSVFCHNETDDRLYVSDWYADQVVIIDARSRLKVGRYGTGYGVSDLAWSRVHNRVYATGFHDSLLTVYDARAGQVIATIPGLVRPSNLLLDEDRGKLYVTCKPDLVVVDLGTNSVRTRIPMPGEPKRMVKDNAGNRLCVTEPRIGLQFVDLDADTVTGSIALGIINRNVLALNHEDRRLHIAGAHDARIATVDLKTDSVVATRAFPHAIPNRMVWCPNTNRVFAATVSGLWVLDGTSGEPIAQFRGNVADVTLDPELGRVYICETAPDTLFWIPTHLSVRDCATLELLTTFRVGNRLTRVLLTPGASSAIWVADEEGSTVAAHDRATWSELAHMSIGAMTYAAAWNSTDNRLYLTNEYSRRISVIDGTSLTPDTINIGSYHPRSVHWVQENNKLYVATWGSWLVIPPEGQRTVVVDGATNRVLAVLPGEGSYANMTYSRTSDKAYVYYHMGPGYPRVYVVDGRTDELLTTIAVRRGYGPIVWYPDSNWVFVDGQVIDCETDAVFEEIPGLEIPVQMLYNPLNNTIYCAEYSGQIALIDAPSRTIRKRLAVGMRPFTMAWDSLGNRIFVGSIWGGTVDVIDCELDMVVASIATPGGWFVRSLNWNHLNQKLYVTETESAMVHIVDGVTLKITSSIPLRYLQFRYYMDLAWDPANNRTYVVGDYTSRATVLRDNPPGIAGPPGVPAGHKPSGPTIVRGVLSLPRDMGAGHNPILLGESGLCPKPAALLFDATGRKVMDLQPGENDVRHLAPGVYFIRASLWERSPDRDCVRKVVIQR